MATRPVKPDAWGYERIGYTDERVVAYAPATAGATDPAVSWLRWERRVATALLAFGVLWGLHVLEPDFSNRSVLWQTPGPLESCGLAALLFLHTKWHGSVRPR